MISLDKQPLVLKKGSTLLHFSLSALSLSKFSLLFSSFLFHCQQSNYRKSIKGFLSVIHESLFWHALGACLIQEWHGQPILGYWQHRTEGTTVQRWILCFFSLMSFVRVSSVGFNSIVCTSFQGYVQGLDGYHVCSCRFSCCKLLFYYWNVILQNPP